MPSDIPVQPIMPEWNWWLLTIVFKIEFCGFKAENTLLVADSPLSDGSSSALLTYGDLRILDSKPDALPTE